MDMLMYEYALNSFESIFGNYGDIRTYYAPGRVNLIGEHTDYNGGHVFPCALTIGTYGVARLRDDNKVRFYSMNFETCGIIESDISIDKPQKRLGWGNYLQGVIHTFTKAGYEIGRGMDILVYGNIPNGSGLSSSASVEVLMAYICNDLLELNISRTRIALLCQQAENEFNGVACGIMDQFIIANAVKNTALFLDTSTLEYEAVPVELEDCSLMITCTNKKRGLANSEYNNRRAECNEALLRIQKVNPSIMNLGQLNNDEFEEYVKAIADNTLIRRARHAVYENQRTIKAVELLKNNDLKGFGRLMNESHESLRRDYEVTGIELDTLVQAAQNVPGVLGSRMTGAGFGGCSVTLLKKTAIDEFVDSVGANYKAVIGYDASFYSAETADGVKRHS